MLDLRLLQHALTLARYRNFARAAQALHMTQPALSRSIAGLEASLGEALFERSRQGVHPTAFGQMLLARAQSLLDDAAELERDFKLMRGLEIGELHVGTGPYPAELSIGRAVAHLTARHPSLRIDVTTSDLRHMVDAILARRLDLAVIELSTVDGDTRLLCEPMPRHPGAFYVRAGHALLAHAALTLEQVLAFPFVGTRLPARVAPRFLEVARRGSIDPETGDYLPPIKADTHRMAAQVVGHSDAVAIAPLALLAEPLEAGELAALPIWQPWMTTAYGFVRLRDRVCSPAAEAFMAEVRTIERELDARSQALAASYLPAAAAGAAAGPGGRGLRV